MTGRLEKHLPFGERLADKAEFIVFEVPKPTVYELRARRGRVRCEVMLLTEQDIDTAPGQIAGDSYAIDPTADDQDIALRRCISHSNVPERLPCYYPSPEVRIAGQ